MMPYTRVVIQSRLSSSRLPGKALLALGERPAVVLCAQRACNTGLPVIVATSVDETDDALIHALEQHEIPSYRGSLDDVLSRFVNATADLEEGDQIVRLTADNVFPDGEFIQDLIAQFEADDLEYLGTSSSTLPLPYGLSAEIFKVSSLRKADRETRSDYDREHVTPYIRNNFKAGIYQSQEAVPAWHDLRCTLDSFQDYVFLSRLFVDVEHPVEIPWLQLVHLLERLSSKENFLPSFALGTAQLGMSYGIANTRGDLSPIEVTTLIREALAHGVTTFDTARAYGKSESRLGAAIKNASKTPRVITKLAPLTDYADDTPFQIIRQAVRNSIFESCHALQQRSLDTLLLHRWPHRFKWKEAAWKELLSLKEDGLICQLGVSVSSPEEAEEALSDAAITHIQCPVNILDWRWRSERFLHLAESRSDVEFFGRSIYLQGILLLPPSKWPTFPGLSAEATDKVLSQLTTELDRTDRRDLCLSYVRSLDWLNKLVIGLESPVQLKENVDLFGNRALTKNERDMVDSALPRVPAVFLNPANWHNK